MELNVLGTSKVALTICRRLVERSHTVGFVVSRFREKAQRFVKDIGSGVPITYEKIEKLSGVVFFAVPDSVIAQVYERTKDRILPGTCLIHFSGFHSSKIFADAEKLGFHRASMHPNLSFADPVVAQSNLSSCIFGVEGDEEGLRIAIELVEDISKRYVVLSEDGKAGYHLAAVVCSNFVVGLAALAEKIYEKSGVEDSQELMGNLIDSVAQNIKMKGVAGSLTGPVARGDWEVVKKEGELFKNIFPQLALFYDQMVELLRSLKEGRL
ncbi:MAG: hypothetical protein XD58_1273 [Thermotoga sp. 50_1627]|uniref:Rossmann-like and DUF2520 domain-containing protein n=1 Tax=Pseudothermotoga sp. TaxID=2033661 RepID=UPI00076C1B46|nr:MAG: hypothetical protein XD45_0778 [Thermotoga sp. 50_64]KUK24773.1 MAG: hypothetical protein XD58_1273 [Thermotoga sp. 50_1627]MBC7116464.1 DUF2520 domain-containing protein [Pseudothermotoga sp.]HBT40323.1 DUF2520 domain-containing protein [Pseudothermotoga sp.]HCO98918.1 DUF2520 domain-containing protein [Pseudothermotoga sp.]